MIDEKLKRINELSKKSKAEGLNESEKAEQAELRREYVDAFKSDLKATLDNTFIVDEHGNKTKVVMKSK